MKKILSIIVGTLLVVAFVENNEFKEMNQTLDLLENVWRTKSFFIEKLKDINEEQKQFTIRNTEDYSRELTKVTYKVKQHLLKVTKSLNLLKRLQNVQKDFKDSASNNVSIIDYKNVTFSENIHPFVHKFKVRETEIFENFTKLLCDGKISLTPNIVKNLKCRYIDRGNWFLKIAPFKEEDAYLEPRISIYHNILNDAEIESLKNMALPLLEDSVIEIDNEGLKPSKIRFSKVAWLLEENHKHVSNVNRRVEFVTGLTIDTAEYLQVSYYQKDGYYNLHHDFDNKEEPFKELGTGNRIATFMYYLNDVKEGGRTVFPYLNVSLTPEKGSAVFWYKLLQNGELDFYTLHAGCPVIAGTKWVANKWLHEMGQEFRRLCNLRK